MKLRIKIIRWLDKRIYGKKRRPFPIKIEEVTNRYCKGLKNWKIKQCSKYFVWKKLYTSPWCLPSNRYPKEIKLVEGEVGANALSKTRYFLKQK